MTISVTARSSSGAYGVIITSSSPAVAARCAYVRPGVGAAVSQNVTDPRLGLALLDLMSADVPASHAVEDVVRRPGVAQFAAYRQVAAVGRDGHAAAFSGDRALGISGHRIGDGVVVAGNLLASERVLDAALEAFTRCEAPLLEERLIEAIRGAAEAGGEMGPLHSVGLIVTESVDWPLTDLRVDWSEAPLEDLDALWALWQPQRDDYLRRALDPTEAPSFGVPGDE